jgi:hypothetical protein
LYNGYDLILRTKVREYRYLERSGQGLNAKGARCKPDREHAGATHGIDHSTDFGNVGTFLQRAEVQANGGALEEARRGRDAAGQLVENDSRIGGADPYLHQSHLAKTDIDCRLARGIGWLVRHLELCFLEIPR